MKRVLLITTLVLMILLIGLLILFMQLKNKDKTPALTYHYVQALVLDRTEIVEPQEEESSPIEITPIEEELTEEEQEILRFITGQHRVRPGDSFSLVTGEYWEDIYLWPDLYIRNEMLSDDPDLIFPDEIIDIYNRLGQGNNFTEAEKEELLAAYIEVYHVFKSLGDHKDSSARALLYTATKYEPLFMEIYRNQIDQDDRVFVERWIEEQGYLE